MSYLINPYLTSPPSMPAGDFIDFSAYGSELFESPYGAVGYGHSITAFRTVEGGSTLIHVYEYSGGGAPGWTYTNSVDLSTPGPGTTYLPVGKFLSTGPISVADADPSIVVGGVYDSNLDDVGENSALAFISKVSGVWQMVECLVVAGYPASCDRLSASSNGTYVAYHGAAGDLRIARRTGGHYTANQTISFSKGSTWDIMMEPGGSKLFVGTGTGSGGVRVYTRSGTTFSLTTTIAKPAADSVADFGKRIACNQGAVSLRVIAGSAGVYLYNNSNTLIGTFSIPGNAANEIAASSSADTVYVAVAGEGIRIYVNSGSWVDSYTTLTPYAGFSPGSGRSYGDLGFSAADFYGDGEPYLLLASGGDQGIGVVYTPPP